MLFRVGWLGRATCEGCYPSALLGLVSHYGIAITMAAEFWFASRRWPALVHKPLLTGSLYGLALYAVMTYVVVPLSNAGTGELPAWKWESLSHIAGHMLLVGIPCALGARLAPAAHRAGCRTIPSRHAVFTNPGVGPL